MPTTYTPTAAEIAAARCIVANPHTVPAAERAEVFATAWYCLTQPRRPHITRHFDGDAA